MGSNRALGVDGVKALALLSFMALVSGCRSTLRTGSASAGAAVQVQVIDLSQPLSASTPYFPGGVPFRLERVTGYDRGYLMNQFTTGEHTGTHVDAPAHFVPGSATVDSIPPDQLVGPGVVVDVVERVSRDPDYRVTLRDLRDFESVHGRIPPGAIVLLRTGWGDRFSDAGRYRNSDPEGVLHFPGFSEESSLFLVDERHVAALGIDTLSGDFGPSKDYAVHRAVLGANRYLIENVAHLDRLPPCGFTVVVAPLPIAGGSGSPARVMALLPRP